MATSEMYPSDIRHNKMAKNIGGARHRDQKVNSSSDLSRGVRDPIRRWWGECIRSLIYLYMSVACALFPRAVVQISCLILSILSRQRPISQRVCNYKLFCLQSQTIFTIFVKSDFTNLYLLGHFQQEIFVNKFVNCKNKGTFNARYLQIAYHCKRHVEVQASYKTCWIPCAN